MSDLEQNAQQLKKGGAETPAARFPCPAPGVWLDVAAGIVAEERLMPLLSHAAGCASCAGALRTAIALFADEESPDEAAFLDALPGSNNAGQALLVARIIPPAIAPTAHASSNVIGFRTTPPAQLSRRRSLVAGLAIAAALLVAAVVGYRIHESSADTALIAQAYSLERPSELRIPGSEATTLVSPTRGAGGAPAESAELLELKIRAQRAFTRNPNDAAVRQTLGQIALVEHNGEAALRQFEMAEVLNPRLSRLNFDLGSAYFELAENGGQTLDYARAIDHFSQYLAESKQQDPVALFDRGLCWERQSINSEAEKDFQAALAAEKDPGWRHEIESHLRRLKAISEESRKAAQWVAFSPAQLLSRTYDPPALYELALAIACREWLPKRGDDPAINAALAEVARLGREQHHDAWLTEVLAHPPTLSEGMAEAALGQALNLSAAGKSDAAFDVAKEAARQFYAAGNRAGALRAEAEQVYLLHQLERPEEGLALARRLLSRQELKRYGWLDANLTLELASNLGMSGDFIREQPAVAAASQLTRANSLPLLHLRATAFNAYEARQAGRFSAAWDSYNHDLGGAYGMAGTAVRRSQNIAAMAECAHALQLSRTEIGLEEAAATQALQLQNPIFAATYFEALAVKELHLGQYANAEKSLHVVDTQLARLGSVAAADVLLREFQSDRSELRAATGGISSAIQEMERAEPQIRASTSRHARLSFYTALSSLLHQAHRPDESLDRAWQAVREAEQIRTNVLSSADREAWFLNSDRAYRILALNFAERGQPELALRAWEWLRSAPHRTFNPAIAGAGLTDFTLFAPGIPAPPPGQATLVVAELEGHYVGWVLTSADRSGDQPKIAFHVIEAPPEEIQVAAQTLLRLCSDPTSSEPDLRVIGARLDSALLAPFADELNRSEVILLDVGPRLATTPFAAIWRNGSYFGLTHALLQLPDDWTLPGPPQPPSRLQEVSGLVVLRQAPAMGKAYLPEEYDEATYLQRKYPGTYLAPVTLLRRGSSLALTGPSVLSTRLATAHLLHYTGHGLSDQPTDQRAEANSPGKLVSPEVSIMMLAPATLHHCELAVLAACRSSAEREETTLDVPSFARILLAAGAARVLATQWDVDSRMTQGLMIRFYAELANHQTYFESLRRAQKYIESDTVSAHPYFWAAFQLVGRPSAR